jgi:ADP-ribose pyrophosphatase YjhB (NUDIX family)
MELIKEITEKDLGYNDENTAVSYKLRKASRSIVLNDSGEMALLYVSKNNYHKLPGGGIEEGEDIRIALNREVMEEVGVEIEVLGEVGITIEYRNKHELLQVSYCYYSKMKGNINAPSFTEEELNDGFQLKWVSVDEAINILESDVPNNYVGKFIQNRDLMFLRKAKEII